MNINGSCLCGKVKIHLPNVSSEVAVCHCQMRQKFFSSSFIFIGKKIGNFEIIGENWIKKYASSENIERGFCKNCGSSLFYWDKKSYHVCFPVGLFDDLENVQLTTEFYTEYKPSYLNYQEDTLKITEKQMQVEKGAVT